MEQVQISIELPRGLLSALRQDPAGFVREMRLAAAVKMIMRTIETTVTIGPDGKLMLQLPPDISPGEHRIVVVIDEPPRPAKVIPTALTFQAVPWPNWPAKSTFRREELYDDEGR